MDLLSLTGLMHGLGMMPQTQPPPQQVAQARPQRPPDAMAGHGLARGAVDVNRLQSAYQQAQVQAQMDGQEFPDFETWLKIQGIARPGVMPR